MVINVKFILILNKLKIVIIMNILCNNVNIDERFMCYLNCNDI